MRKIVLLTLYLTSVLSAMGRTGDVIVSVQPIDAFTGEKLWNAYAQVIGSRGDTIADSRFRVQDITLGMRIICLDLPDSTATYTMRTYFDGYEPGEFEFQTRRRGKNTIELPENKMVKIRQQQLDEVTVTASKVKMVMKGDTIVYNADAFQLANGSMLDALVSQLPGVAIEDGGRITVNGRKVDELTINGENFFQGNPRIALENLPAYTVNKIKVYEPGRTDSYITGQSVPEIDKPLRMDVNLKKEYVFGWMGNAEVGYGLRNRYLGKAFAFGFTNTFRFSAFANFNNIKDAQSASGGRWTSGQQQNGEMALQMGGADYAVKNRVGDAWTFRAQGNLIARGDQINLIAEGTSTMFYPSQDLCKLSRQQDRSKRFSLNSSHSFEVKLPQVYASITPRIDFRRDNQRRTETERSSYDLAAEELIYTYDLNSNSRFEDVAVNLSGEATVDSRWRNDYAKFTMDLGHHSSNENLMRNYAFSYFDAVTPDSRSSERNRTRSREYNASAKAAYTYVALQKLNPFALLNFTPTLGYDFRSNNNDVSRRKPEFDDPLGGMASDEIKYIIDLNNSYNSQKYSHSITPGIDAVFCKTWRHTHEWQFSFRENITFDHINYLKAGDGTVLSRRKALPELSLLYRFQRRGVSWYVKWEYEQSLPNISYLINTTDIIDPLNRYLGNSALKNASQHSVKANFQIRSIYTTVDLGWKKMDNLVAYTKFHDIATGVNTWQPMNVNGNWTVDGNVRFGKSFGKRQKWSFSTVTTAIYNHSIDFVSLSDTPQESLVKNTCLKENISVSHTFGKSTARLGLYGVWRHATSAQEEFGTINAFDLTPSFALNISLPYDFQIESDLKLYLRRGYSASELNTTDWGWNATISKSILKGNLKFSLTGVDILGQIKPVHTILNAQGRTEIRYNTIPRYAMLHIIYRLNIQPRKK